MTDLSQNIANLEMRAVDLEAENRSLRDMGTRDTATIQALQKDLERLSTQRDDAFRLNERLRTILDDCAALIVEGLRKFDAENAKLAAVDASLKANGKEAPKT